MSIIEAHVKLAHHAYLEELASELAIVIKKKKAILEKSDATEVDLNNLPVQDRKTYKELATLEDQIIVELVRYKKWFDLPCDAFKKFAEETKYEPKKK